MGQRDENPHIEEERQVWEMLRKKHIAAGDNPLHPAFRYATWEAFVAAGKPWHNHGEPKFHNMSFGDKASRWEANRRAPPKFNAMRRIQELQDLGLIPIREPSRGLEPMLPRREETDIIPAAVRLQMLADANGGLGPIGLTPASPESAIRAYLESVDRNGFKPPGNIRIA